MTNETPVPARFGGPIRRITELQVQAGEEGQTAVEIATTGRVGVFEGVHVDFTHADLPPGEWWARPWWHVWADGEQHCGLIFPGEAKAAEADGIGWKRIRERTTREEIFALPGDRLTVARVQQLQEVTFLHHPHDYSVRYAFLTLTRPDGTTINDIGPLAFYGSTRLIGHGSREAFDNAIARIATLSLDGLQLPKDEEGFLSRRLEPWKHSPSEAALHFAGEAHDELFSLIDELSPDDTSGYVRLRSLVNAALLAGFALAKHEAQPAERQAAGAAKGAKAGGEKTADHVSREMAKKLWAENPTETAYWVAKQICATHQDKDPNTVTRSIKHLTPSTSKSYNPSGGYGQ